MKRSALLPLLALGLGALALGGCGSADAVPAHSETEQKAIDAEKNMTPEQRIEQIKNSPMPEGAKADMIARIKAGGTK